MSSVISVKDADLDAEYPDIPNYNILNEIGSGSFGIVFLGTHNVTGEMVAVKAEPRKQKTSLLKHEAKIYKDELKDVVGIPKFFWYGKIIDPDGDINVMAMELLGPSLDILFHSFKHSFVLKTVLLLADQMIDLVEAIHNRNYIHRDLQGGNFVMGLGEKSSTLYLVDFGMAKKYRTLNVDNCLEQIPYREGKRDFIGNGRFASLNVHNGIEPDRRDDMISLGYIFLYLLRGCLPWQIHKDIKAENSAEYYRRVKETKERLSAKFLRHNYPIEFELFLDYSMSLEYGDKPNYEYLRTLLRKLAFRRGYKYDGVFAWDNLVPFDHTFHSKKKKRT